MVGILRVHVSVKRIELSQGKILGSVGVWGGGGGYVAGGTEPLLGDLSLMLEIKENRQDVNGP
jgi:hypothetical protein